MFFNNTFYLKIQNIITATCNQCKKTVNKLFYFWGILSLWNPSCIVHCHHYSIQASHISRAQHIRQHNSRWISITLVFRMWHSIYHLVFPEMYPPNILPQLTEIVTSSIITPWSHKHLIIPQTQHLWKYNTILFIKQWLTSSLTQPRRKWPLI